MRVQSERKIIHNSSSSSNMDGNAVTSLFGSAIKPKKLDPAVASLFSTSIAPTKRSKPAGKTKSVRDIDHDIVAVSSLPPAEEANVPEEETHEVPHGSDTAAEHVSRSSKRKRKHAEDDIEGQYLQRLSRQEAREYADNRKERLSKKAQLEPKPLASLPVEVDTVTTLVSADSGNSIAGSGHPEVEFTEDHADDVGFDDVPQHESLAGAKSDVDDLEKAARTVFLANVSTSAITSKSAKKTLMNHLASFLPTLASHDPAHKLESFRFRSTAFVTALPKRAAFARRSSWMPPPNSTNAYVVYSTQIAAREAAKQLNGTIVLDRHLRVDQVSHPAKVDHHRCVFVGNLGFVDDDSAIKASEEDGEKRKPSKKMVGDVEEGLWRQFGKAGTVESVRVVRDPKTRVGKGFAYVQFTDENAVETAPSLQRQEVSTPAAAQTSSRSREEGQTKSGPGQQRGEPRLTKPSGKVTASSAEQKSFQGRASKLLGKAGGS
ncbi:hypothetical protein MRB53_037153 [Persea americana]|nr:hypothetical protein MRB53_037153 [Persea americana]